MSAGAADVRAADRLVVLEALVVLAGFVAGRLGVPRDAFLGARDVERLLGDPAIVRNRLKVESTVANARAVIEVGGLDELLWSFVGGSPRVNAWRSPSELPAETDESRAMSKELKRRGFRFVGPTICYSLMQACGLVNDHVTSCFRYREV